MESSRIFVRGLPPKFTEDDVRKHFSKYAVTDVKFFPHRRIGYVGYKTPDDAAKAVKYFNKSFIRMSKIFVEIARPVSTQKAPGVAGQMLMILQIADQSLPKSRRQQKEEAAGPRHSDYVPPPKDNNLKRKRAEEEAEQDPKLKEFLDVMQAPSKTKSWANDTPIGERPIQDPATVVEQAAVPEDESDNEYQVIEKKAKTAHAAAPSATPAVVPPVQADDAPVAEASGDTPEQSEQDTENAPVATEAPVSDADWLRPRTNRVLDLVEDDDPSPQPTSNVPQSPEFAMQEEAEPEKMDVDQPEQLASTNDEVDAAPATETDKVRQTGRLYLRNLHFDITSDDIREHFSKYGVIEEVRQFSCSFFFCYDEYP